MIKDCFSNLCNTPGLKCETNIKTARLQLYPEVLIHIFSFKNALFKAFPEHFFLAYTFFNSKVAGSFYFCSHKFHIYKYYLNNNMHVSKLQENSNINEGKFWYNLTPRLVLDQVNLVLRKAIIKDYLKPFTHQMSCHVLKEHPLFPI